MLTCTACIRVGIRAEVHGPVLSAGTERRRWGESHEKCRVALTPAHGGWHPMSELPDTYSLHAGAYNPTSAKGYHREHHRRFRRRAQAARGTSRPSARIDLVRVA